MQLKEIIGVIPWGSLVWLILGLIVIKKIAPPLVAFIDRAKTFKAGAFTAEASNLQTQQLAAETPANVLEAAAESSSTVPTPGFIAELAEATRPYQDYSTFQIARDELETKLAAENPTDEQLRTLLVNGGALFGTMLEFENIHAIIFGSQISLLQDLNVGITMNMIRVKSFFEKAANVSPLIYAEYKFEGWLEFIRSRGLIQIEKDNVRITDKGRDFLKYIIQTGKVVSKPG